MGNAHKPGGGGEIVFLVGIHQRSRDEHERAVRADQKKCGRHFPAVAQTKPGVMLGLGEQVVEGFKFVRLHWQYGDANGAKGQESLREMGKTLPQ